jgi:hypothetical protein
METSPLQMKDIDSREKFNKSYSICLLSVLSERHRKINEASMKCMHGQHLLTLSNAFFKFTVFELYKKKIDK